MNQKIRVFSKKVGGKGNDSEKIGKNRKLTLHCTLH